MLKGALGFHRTAEERAAGRSVRSIRKSRYPERTPTNRRPSALRSLYRGHRSSSEEFAWAGGLRAVGAERPLRRRHRREKRMSGPSRHRTTRPDATRCPHESHIYSNRSSATGALSE